MANLLSNPNLWHDGDGFIPPQVWDGTHYNYDFPAVTLTFTGTANTGDVVAFTAVDPSNNSEFNLTVNGSPVASNVAITGTPIDHNYSIPAGASVVLEYTVINTCATVPVTVLTPDVVHVAPFAPDESIVVQKNSHNNVVTPLITEDGTPVANYTLAIIGGAGHGIAAVSGHNLLYTPTSGYVGPDVFTYRATDTDSELSSNTGTVTVNVVDDCKELGRTTRTYVTGYSLSRVNITRVRRMAKRCVVANFNGAIPKERSIVSVRWETTSPWAILMSNARIASSQRDTMVDVTFNFSGWGGLLATVTLDNGEVYNAEFSFTVLDTPLYPSADYPIANGPYRLDANV